MFVSRDAALRRLKSDDNIFKGEVKVVLDRKAEVIEEVTHLEDTEPAEHLEDPEEADGVKAAVDLLSATDREFARAHSHPSNGVPLGQDLDRLIDGLTEKRPLHPYRMNRPVQAAIGEVALIAGQKTARAASSLGSTQTSLYSQGHAQESTRVSGSPRPPELAKRIDEAKLRIARITTQKLRKVMIAITSEKIEAIESPSELARMGKDLAHVIDKVTPKETGTGEGVHFHIYRPEQGQMKEYQTVSIGRKTTSVDKNNVIDV